MQRYAPRYDTRRALPDAVWGALASDGNTPAPWT